MLNQKSILITGGTGSFGTRFTRTLLRRYTPKRIVIFSRDELKQFEMRQQFDQDCMRYFIGDVRDKDRLTMAMNGIDYVIHAAALKQVPAAEYNPPNASEPTSPGLKTSSMPPCTTTWKRSLPCPRTRRPTPTIFTGPPNCARTSSLWRPNNFAGTRQTLFSVVRYGNVVGSRGSVVPYFKKLIREKSDHIPITHEKMTRFWITLQEGVDFVIQNFSRMSGGEIYVPKIPSIKIIDLARAMAPDIPQKIIGIRPGEKLHEVMCPADDSHLTVEFEDHYIILPAISFRSRKLEQTVNNLGKKEPL